MLLSDGIEEKEYVIKKINLEDEDLKNFLFSLGCYSGEKITIIRKTKSICIVAIKDARYSIDKHLAKTIEI